MILNINFKAMETISINSLLGNMLIIIMLKNKGKANLRKVRLLTNIKGSNIRVTTIRMEKKSRVVIEDVEIEVEVAEAEVDNKAIKIKVSQLAEVTVVKAVEVVIIREEMRTSLKKGKLKEKCSKEAQVMNLNLLSKGSSWETKRKCGAERWTTRNRK